MIEVAVLKFEGVVARPAPSLCEYIESMVPDRSFSLVGSIVSFYASRQPFESYFPDVLEKAGVPAGDVLEVMNRTSRALAQVEAWRIYDDVPAALDWMDARRIPVAMIFDWPVTPQAVLGHMGQKTPSIDIPRTGSLSTVFWELSSHLGVAAELVLYVAAQEADYEDARALGARAVIMDREGGFDETVPNINHLIELELHI